MSFADRFGGHVEVPRRTLAILGTVFAVVLVGTVGAVLTSFSGGFGNYVLVNAELPSAGNAISLNTPVQYRDVTVGTVASQGHPLPGGVVSVKLKIKPGQLAGIPASVRATVGPLSIFGNQSVQLEAPPAPPGAPSLKGGETIQALASGSTASLQSTLGDLDTVLNAIHPAQLDIALTSLATALQGQGKLLGDTLSQSSTYLGLMLPYLPTFEADLALLTPVANNLAQSTPNLLNFLANLTVTGQTITGDQSLVHQSLVGGATLAGQTTQFLTTIQTPFEHLVADFGPFLTDLAGSGQTPPNPNEIAQILQGLDTWSKAWIAAESKGPYLSLTSTVAIPNPADAVLASLGAPNVDTLFALGIGTNLVNPPTYTAANCPRYGTELGHCGATASTTSAVRSAGSPGSPGTAATATMPEPQQSQAVEAILAGLSHGQPPASAGEATLLLAPILQAIAG